MDTTNNSRSRILVVDDDCIFTEVADLALSEDGFAVTRAANGILALEQLERGPFDLALIDLNMPRMNGFALLQAIRSHPVHKYLPVIVITGRQDERAIEKAFHFGATSFVTKPIEWNIIIHDVHFVLKSSRMEAELRNAKAAVEEASQLKSNLISIISHEFRTPLHTLAGFSSLLKDELGDGQDTKTISQYADYIGTAASRMSTMFNNILLVGKSLNEGIELREDEYRLAEIITGVVESFRESATARKIPLVTEISINPDTLVCCDKQLICRALGNILDNAIKFSPSGQYVFFDVRTSPSGELLCSIVDDGPGMTAVEIEKAGKLFTQLDMSASRKADGLGMGLTTARQIAEAHGGRLDMESAPSKGTLASLVLPASRIVADKREQTGQGPSRPGRQNIVSFSNYQIRKDAEDWDDQPIELTGEGGYNDTAV